MRFALVTPAILLLSLAVVAVAVAPTHTAVQPRARTIAAGVPAAPRISTRVVRRFGRVLVDGSGATLYTFRPDSDGRVECVRACAALWPPLLLRGAKRAQVLGGAQSSLVGSRLSSSGARVVTYAGWPLYRFLGDVPGMARGQAQMLHEPCLYLNLDCSLNLAGSVWFALRASGRIIHTT